MFHFSNYSAKPKYYGKMKNQITGVAIKEFVGLKLNTYSFLVDDSW